MPPFPRFRFRKNAPPSTLDCELMDQPPMAAHILTNPQTHHADTATTPPTATSPLPTPKLSPQSPPSTDPTTLRILTFGDSLLAGYHSSGLSYHPPATRLTTFLRASLPPSTRISVSVSALPGDRVFPPGSFLPRLQQSCPPPPAPPTYDIIIILGGTNDLCCHLSVSRIFAALVRVWEAGLATGARVVGTTVPERSADFGAGKMGRRGTARREELNALIRGWGDGGGRWAVWDLCKEVRWGGVGVEERDRVWDDGLHFTEAGYEVVGERMGEFVLGMLGGEWGDGAGRGGGLGEFSGGLEEQGGNLRVLER